jgi:hypothetical protein
MMRAYLPNKPVYGFEELGLVKLVLHWTAGLTIAIFSRILDICADAVTELTPSLLYQAIS